MSRGRDSKINYIYAINESNVMSLDSSPKTMPLTKNPTDGLILLLLLQVVIAEGEAIAGEAQQNATTKSTTVAPPLRRWLERVTNQRGHGCKKRPWICNQDQDQDPPKTRKLCCKDRCVDVNSDVNNCGFCGIRCPFTWQCCGGVCINTNFHPFHCGRCYHRCPFRSFCLYGMCGYAAPPPPPFPFPPKPPKPPHHPFPPKPPHHPFPPKPPHHPFPPKPPHHPFPPHPPHGPSVDGGSPHS
ncbi:hypothetical protein U1Q18_024051 [Sarracenia purpurea var. burkii]